MNVHLGDRWEQFVQEKLKGGDYQNASELVRDGLRLIEERDLLKRVSFASLEELRSKIREGLQTPASEMTAKDWGNLRDLVKKAVPAKGAK